MLNKPRRCRGIRLGEFLESRQVFSAAGFEEASGSNVALAAQFPSDGLRAPPLQFVTNGGFEAPTLSPWYGKGPVSLAIAGSEGAHSGTRGLRISNRPEFWNGAGQSILGRLTPGQAYRASVYVKLVSGDPKMAQLMISQKDAAGQQYIEMGTGLVNTSEWTKLRGVFRYRPTAPVETLELYIQGLEANFDFYVDDFSVEPYEEVDWRAAADARIDALRKRDVKLELIDETGAPFTDASIHVEQTRNAFGFGTTINSEALAIPNYREFIAKNFQWGATEGSLKWQIFEPNRGDFQIEAADRLVNFAKSLDMPLRGHTIFWEKEEFVSPWVKNLSTAELRSAVDARIENIVGRYKDDLVHWDVNNEMLHGNFYQGRLGPQIGADMFKKAEATAPHIQYFVNDYNVVEGGETESYIQQIQSLLQQGAPVEAIGVQGHFNEVFPDLMLERLDKLAALDLPIWFTEFDVVAPDVQERARQVETFYRLAFSHPAVQGTIMWGFWAGQHWRGPNAALVDQDWTVNAAGQAYQRLMQEWRTDLISDVTASGDLSFRGFHGDYQITVNLPEQAPRTFRINVLPGDGVETFRFQVDRDNTAPVLTAPDNFQLTRGVAGSFDVSLSDGETPLEQLSVKITSDNHNLLPVRSIVMQGTGAVRTLQLTPTALRTGIAKLRIEVRDSSGMAVSREVRVFVVTPKPNENLLENAGLENGSASSLVATAPTVFRGVSRDQAHSGQYSLVLRNRQFDTYGVGFSLLNILAPGESAEVTAYVRLRNEESAPVKFTLRQRDLAGLRFQPLETVQATNTSWTRIQARFRYTPQGPGEDLFVYLEGPPAGVDFYVDDVAAVVVGAFRDGDITGDGFIDLNDVSRLRRNFGKTNANRFLGDLNGDGRVDLADFALVRLYFGR